MAHSDWVNQSSRVVNAKAIVKAYDSFKSNIKYDDIEHYFTVEFLETKPNGSISSASASALKSMKYLQISGNKDKNIYPVDLQITNSRVYKNTGEELFNISISNNNSTDLIIELKSNIIPSEIDIIVTKWSKYINNSDITSSNFTDYITYIGTSIQFDLIKCNMLKTFEVENGLCYDGTSELSYGIKTSESSLEVTKDIPNTGIAISSKDSIVNTLLNFDIGNEYYQNENTDYVRVFIASKNNINIIANHKYFGMSRFFTYLYKDSSSISDTFNVYLSPSTQSGSQISSLSGSQISVGKGTYSDSYFYGSWDKSYENISFTLRPYKFMSSASYEFRCYLYNNVFIDLTQIFGYGKEPDLEWCKNNLSFSGETAIKYNYITNLSILSRAEMCTRLENKPYIQFSMGLDKEIVGKRIGNYYIDTFDYDEEKPTFTLNIKDNTSKLSEAIFDGLYTPDIYTSPTGYQSLSVLFNKYINNMLYNDTGLSIDWDINTAIELNTASYPMNVYYSEVYNKACQVLKDYIIQDIEDVRKIKFLSSQTYLGYRINYNQCFSVSIYNNLDNAIKNINCETFSFVESSNSNEKLQESIVTPTMLDGYITPDPAVQNTINENYSLLSRVLVPKLTVNGNEITGIFRVSQEDYKKYPRFSIRLYGARAKFTIKFYAVQLSVSAEGVPSGDNDETKDYIHFDSETGEIVVTEISKLTDDDYFDIKWQKSDFNIKQSEDGAYIDINYTIKFDNINDSLLNSTVSTIQPFSAIVGQELCNEKYLGAYKVLLFGSGYDSSSISAKYSIGSGNSYDMSSNEFIQTGCKAILPDLVYAESPTVNDYLANSILEEFGNGVKTAEIEWVGSPYIKLFDLITLDNGITYRVHYIKNKYDGGYRQVLRLVEYKQ